MKHAGLGAVLRSAQRGRGFLTPLAARTRPPGHGGTAGAASHRVGKRRENYNSQVHPARLRMRDPGRAILPPASSISSLAEGGGRDYNSRRAPQRPRMRSAPPPSWPGEALPPPPLNKPESGTGSGEEGLGLPRNLSMCRARPGRWVPLPGSLRRASPGRFPRSSGERSSSRSPDGGTRRPLTAPRAAGKQQPPPRSPFRSLPPSGAALGDPATRSRRVAAAPPGEILPLSLLSPPPGTCDGAGAFVPGATAIPPAPTGSSRSPPALLFIYFYFF